MKQVHGRYLLQPNKDFPLDCETFDALQTNMHIISILGNIAGDKAILLGCEPEEGGTRRAAGYVFLRTQAHPEGEVLCWEGGNVAGGMYLKEEVTGVTAQGYEYPQAYVTRSLAPGIGSENYDWGSFKTLKTPVQLDEDNQALGDQIARLETVPLGVVQMWAGNVGKIPTDRYRLCDGSTLPVEEYPELYAVLGNLHGGVSGSTFCLPDLRGRFIVGYNPNDNDYNAIARSGGEKTHALTVEEMPSHTHGLFLQNSGTRFTGGGKANELNSGDGKTDATGGGKAHENRPPYYTLAYIMRIK